MKNKIFKNIIFLTIGAVLLTSILTVIVMYTSARNTMEENVREQSGIISAAYNESGEAYLRSISSPERITLVTADGTVVYDNSADSDSMSNHSDRPEISGAMADGTGESIRLSDTLGKETYYYAVKTNDGNILRISNTINSVYTNLLQALPLIICIIVIVIILSLVVAKFSTQKIVDPINKLDLDHPEENVVYEEIAPLLSRMEKQNNLIGSQIDQMNTNRAEFETITGNMQEGLLVIDSKACVLSYNNSALSLLAGNDDFKRGDSVYVLNRTPEFTELVDAALELKNSRKILRLNGRYLELMANPVRVSGQLVGAVIVMMDISEKQQQEDLRREFTANVSHELKTPMTSISGYAEIMMNGLAKPEDTKRFSASIYNEAQRLITLIADIIKLSQLDEGEAVAQRENVNLLEVALSTEKRLQPIMEVNGISMRVVGEKAEINAVRSMMDEMVYNLCDNAVKYNKKGGKIEIRTGVAGGRAYISVSDTGIGIPKADRERIFERFYRVDKSRSKDTGGTGLGLSIVKHIVKLHGGNIAVSDNPGGGTMFLVTF